MIKYLRGKTCGCRSGHPVCEEGKRLYAAAQAYARSLPEFIVSEADWQRLYTFQGAAEAYMVHIGEPTQERYQ